MYSVTKELGPNFCFLCFNIYVDNLMLEDKQIFMFLFSLQKNIYLTSYSRIALMI